MVIGVGGWRMEDEEWMVWNGRCVCEREKVRK